MNPAINRMTAATTPTPIQRSFLLPCGSGSGMTTAATGAAATFAAGFSSNFGLAGSSTLGLTAAFSSTLGFDAGALSSVFGFAAPLSSTFGLDALSSTCGFGFSSTVGLGFSCTCGAAACGGVPGACGAFGAGWGGSTTGGAGATAEACVTGASSAAADSEGNVIEGVSRRDAIGTICPRTVALEAEVEAAGAAGAGLAALVSGASAGFSLDNRDERKGNSKRLVSLGNTPFSRIKMPAVLALVAKGRIRSAIW